MSYYKDTIKYIDEASKKEFNAIPFIFDRFADDLEGITKGTYTIVTASSGVAKSKYTIFMYVITVINFLIANPNATIDAKIIYFSLEESKRKFYLSLQCYLLKQRFDIRVSVKDLRSTKKGKKIVNQDLLDKLASLEDWFKVFEEKVEVIEDIRNTWGMYKYVEEYCLSVGKVVEIEEIVEHKPKKVKHYIPNNPELIILPITDHVSLIQKQKDQPTLWDAIHKWSSDHCIHLRNFYGCSPVDIQQQAAEKEKQDYYKGQTIESKLEPSLDGLGDNKTTQRNADIVLGLFAPDRYDLRLHEGYDIGKLGDHYRSLKILKNREGEANAKIGLLFDGANLTFEELPRKDEFETQGVSLYNKVLKKLKREE